MMHLKIEQNNTVIEQVSGRVIEKLYQLAFSGDLDASSNFVGRLHTAVTYQNYVDFLTQQFQDLYITSDKYYIRFKDPEAERVLKSVTYTTGAVTYTFGDGIGVFADGGFTTMPVLLPDWFRGNTTITQFEELSKAISCYEIYANSFHDCSNLQKINLTNIMHLGANVFQNCTSLTSIGNTNKLTYIGSRCFQNCGLSGTVSLPNVTTVADLAFFNVPNLTTIDFGPFLSSMNWQSVWDCSSDLKMIFRGSTPPTVSGDDTRLYNKSFTIYIPDGCKDTYIQEAHFAANESKIHFISELES